MTSFKLVPVEMPQVTQRMATGGIAIALGSVLIIECAEGGHWQAVPARVQMTATEMQNPWLSHDHVPENAVRFGALTATSTPVTASAFVSAEIDTDYAAQVTAYWTWVSTGVTPSGNALSGMLSAFALKPVREPQQETTTPQTGPPDTPPRGTLGGS